METYRRSASGEPASEPVDPERIAGQVETVLSELCEIGNIRPGQIVVIGTSTSEVIGRHIGTSGTLEAAQAIFRGMERVRERFGFFPAFQCCEHLNRALVVEEELALRHPELEVVRVVPVPKAGGSMAAYAYRTFRNPVVVEAIQAHAGLDIGGTLIGMHLKRVAVPLRPSVRFIGQAWVQMAYSRPKLIGGSRAVYEEAESPESSTCS